MSARRCHPSGDAAALDGDATALAATVAAAVGTFVVDGEGRLSKVAPLQADPKTIIATLSAFLMDRV
jgi:hypothetical protein